MTLSPAPQAFIAEMRTLYASPLAEAERWRLAKEPLKTLLRDQDFRARAAVWAAGEYAHERYFNLLFYEDSDYGFVVNALLKKPGQDTIVHDHGHSWTLYALLEGQEVITRYERAQSDDRSAQRADNSSVEKTDQFTIGPGDIDLVPPWLFHAEAAGDARTVAIIVRSENVGGFKQNQLDPLTGSLRQDFGPTQIPYDGA